MNLLFINNELKGELSLRDVGNNYGNLLFYHSVLEIFKNYNIYFLSNPCDNPDLIVVSIANSICNIERCLNFVNHINDIISKYKCKKILLSIGAQNDNLNIFDLNEYGLDTFNKFFKNFDFINLRGEYTRNILLHNNINFDYNVLGCPSIFLCNKIKFSNTKLNDQSKILFNAPRNKQCNTSFFNSLKNNKNIDLLYQDSYSKSKDNIIVPNGYQNWKDILKKYDFCIGTRIHGAIISLICNVPTLLLVIDSRTHELAEILNIPYINIINQEIKLENKNDIVDLINDYQFNYDNFNEYLDTFRNILKKNLFEKLNI